MDMIDTDKFWKSWVAEGWIGRLQYLWKFLLKIR